MCSKNSLGDMTKAKNKDTWKKEAQNNKRLLKKALVECNQLKTENERLRNNIYFLEKELNNLRALIRNNSGL